MRLELYKGNVWKEIKKNSRGETNDVELLERYVRRR